MSGLSNNFQFLIRRILSAAMCLAVGLAILVTVVPGPALAACGANNQKPCKIWERIPSCDKGLKEDFGQNKCVTKSALSCGKLNQRPCLVVERIPSCNKGLVEDFVHNKCQKKGQGSLKEFEKFAGNFAKKNKKLIKATKDYTATLQKSFSYLSSKAFKKDREQRKFNAIRVKLGVDAFVESLKQSTQQMIPKSLTIGIVMDGGFAAGFSAEHGVAINLTKSGPAALAYRTFAINGGVITGGDATVSVTLWNMVPRDLVGENRGISASGGEIAVGGAGFWFAAPKNAPSAIGYDFKHFQGFGVAAGAGAGILPVDMRGTMALTQRAYNGAPPWRADACGSVSIRPCHVIERFPSCDKGLKENFIKHQCVK